jgi:hypothetical protein
MSASTISTETLWTQLVEILDQLSDDRSPGGPIDKITTLVASIENAAEDRAVQRHGRQILEMIRGDRYQYEGCAAPSI